MTQLAALAGSGLRSGDSFATASLPLVPPSAPVDIRYFGLHMHGIAVRRPWVPHGDRLTPWPSIPFGTWRLWDAYVAWPNLQPASDSWDFATLDTYVELAVRHDVDLILPLGLTPRWASARPNEKSSYKPGNAAEPSNLDAWRAYVRTVATRYKGRIRTYEIWNEINVKGFYTGDVDTLVTLAGIAYREIKALDRDALVVSPSITVAGGHLQWLERYLAKGGKDYADVVAYHFYVPTREPEAMLAVIRDVQATMRKHGLAGTPLWNTETGWWIDNLVPTPRVGAAAANWVRLDQVTAAAYVSRALILNWVAGVARFYWYAWDNNDMGLYDIGARALKPAAHAYAKTVTWLQGAQVQACEKKSGVWVCTLLDALGRNSRIVWRESGDDVPWTVPKEWHARQVEPLLGETQPSAEVVRLGQLPLRIRS